MRISGLFQRAQVQSVAIVGNDVDAEDALIGATERRNLGRRQSNSSDPEAAAVSAESKTTTSPTQEAATKAAPTQPANVPSSNLDVGTYLLYEKSPIAE